MKHIIGYAVVIVVFLYLGAKFGNKLPFIGSTAAA